jgi:teichoic acid transport system permease protein
VALLVVLAAGLAILVSSLQVYFRDLKSFLPYGLRMWLYTSPILYFADEVPDRYQWILVANPLAPMLTAWSDVLIFGRAPDGTDLAIGAAWAFGILIVAMGFFMSREREFAVRL